MLRKATAWLEREEFVTSKDIFGEVSQHPSNALGTEDARSYSHPKGETHPASMAVRLRLLNPSPEPWTAAGAVLRDATGVEVELSVWQESAIPTRALGYVVVGAEKPAEQMDCPCTLASRGGAPADLREALVGPLKRVQVGGVVQVERRIREPDNPPARRGAPRP